MCLSQFLVAGVAAACIYFAAGLAILGPPDHDVQFYHDGQITCSWDNITGAIWCLDPAGIMTCSWHVGSGFFDTPSANTIPHDCWPLNTGGGR